MSGFVDLEERAKRFDAMVNGLDIIDDYGLLKTITLNQIHLKRVTTALNYYLYASLCAWYEKENILFSENILEEQKDNIVNLPNITPNGLVLPKTENCAAYNVLHRELAKAFCETGLGKHIEAIQYPINVRLQNGLPNPTLDSRPRASVKPHTDIWAGDPASGIVIFLSLLGDPKKSGIRFLRTSSFPLSYVKPLDDYDMGKEVIANSEELPCDLEPGKLFVMDPYMIHRTTKLGEALRISLDFRFIPKKLVSSDKMIDIERSPYFIAFEKWRRVGTNSWMSSPDSIKSPFDKTSSQDYTIGYPGQIYLV